MSDKIDQRVANPFDLFAQLAFQLFSGRAQSEIGAGPNQIDDGFGLGQIHFAIQKSALGKFAGARTACTGMQTGFENFGRHERSAMATDLDNILAGVTGRRAMDRHHHFVDQAA